MNDRIRVQNLCLYGHHGVFAEESKLGQRFYIDLDCFFDVSACSGTDDYGKAICYGTLCELAREASDAGPYRLIETLAERIAQAVLARFTAVAKVIVSVRKPSAPVAAQFDWVGITIERPRRYRVGFSLGSNMGDKVANLRTALCFLDAEPDLEIDRVSRFYRTAPWGKEDQDWFLNACATGFTTRRPADLLKAIARIELAVGRVPGERWGPRAIDIDLLFADDLEIETPSLTLPHKEMFNRAFVLVPLAEIAPEHTICGRRIIDAVGALSYSCADISPLEG